MNTAYHESGHAVVARNDAKVQIGYIRIPSIPLTHALVDARFADGIAMPTTAVSCCRASIPCCLAAILALVHGQMTADSIERFRRATFMACDRQCPLQHVRS